MHLLVFVQYCCRLVVLKKKGLDFIAIVFILFILVSLLVFLFCFRRLFVFALTVLNSSF